MPITPKTSTTQPISRRRTIILIIAALLVGGALFQLYQTQQHRTEQAAETATNKATFAEIDTNMTKTHDAIVNAAGKPARDEVFRNCSRVAFKFDKGLLFCGISRHITYPEVDVKGAIQRTSVVEQELKKADWIKTEGLSSIVESLNVDNNQQTTQRDYKVSDQEVRCVFSVDVDTKNVSELSGPEPLGTRFILDCDKRMEQEIYPLAR